MENESNDEKTKAAAVAREREARRRRILENSNNRLSKITGRVHDEGTKVENSCYLHKLTFLLYSRSYHHQ